MRPNFVVFVVILSIISHLSGLTAINLTNADDVEPINEFFLLNIENESAEIKFEDLNVDVLVHIFNYLDFNNLLNIAEANSKLLLPASVAFFNRKARFEVTGAYSDEEGYPQNLFWYNMNKDCYEMNNFEQIMKTLKFFGGSMQQLDIKTNYIRNETRAALIMQNVNKYASKSLNLLTLDSIYEDTLDQFTVPFEEVQNLHLEIRKSVIKNRKFSLNELFPQLNILNLSLHSDTDYSPIVCEYPHLFHLDLYISEDAWHKEDQIFELLKKSPHIKSIDVAFYHSVSIRFDLFLVNRLVPNLQHLSMQNFNIGNKSVYFANVKRLRWERSNSTSIDQLSFSRLESLKIDEYRRHEFQVWSEFFRRNTDLRRLHIALLDETAYLQLIDLTSELPKLTKLTVIQCYGLIYVDVIGQLLSSHRNLETFIFWTDKTIINEVNILRERYENEWYIKDVDFARWVGVSFERMII